MKVKRILIFLCVLLFTGFIFLKYISRKYRNSSNSFLVHLSNFLNDNNTLTWNSSGIERNDVDIFWRSEEDTVLIVKSGNQINPIGYEYGPNGFFIYLKDGPQFNVGHFKTRNSFAHKYTIDLKKDRNGYTIKFLSDGENYANTVQQFDLNGKANGAYCSYYRNGKPSSEEYYEDGMAEGRWKYFYENGKLRVSVGYTHDSLNGYEINYKEDGTIDYKKEYLGGKEISSTH